MSDEKVVLPLDCETVVRELWAYLDGAVTSERLELLEEHLAECVPCRAHEEFERRLVDELAELRRSHSDPERLRARVLERLRRAGMERGSEGPDAGCEDDDVGSEGDDAGSGEE